MCRALQACGAHPLVATTNTDGAGRLDVELGHVLPRDGVPTIFFRARFRYARPLARWLAAHVADFDLVHVHEVFTHASVAAAQASVQAGVPYIVQPHGTLDPWCLGRKRARKQAFMSLVGRRMLLGAAEIHYTTASEQAQAEAPLGLRRGAVVPLGVPDEAFADGRAAHAAAAQPYVLALARLDPKKGLELLIRAFARIDAPGWRLVIAGDGDPAYGAALQAAAREAGVEARVSFCGWLSGPAKQRMLRGASIFALPSHQENFGLAIVEAMARGVPVVVTPGVNLAPDIARAGAGWVAAHDEASVGDALAAAMADARERLRRGAAARALAEQFRWTSAVRALMGRYRAILDRRA